MAADSARPDRESVDTWPALGDETLEVAANSVLDFSSLVEAGPAGRHGWAQALPDGHICFANRTTPQRFFSASFQFSPGMGGFPDRDEAWRLVTQLVRTGYNAVRLQCVEQQLMSGQRQDLDFQSDQFDRFQFLLAELKHQGVYAVVDIAYIDNGGWGGVYPHRWVKTPRQFRRDLFVTEEARSHWKQLLRAMLGQRNPYTGTIPLEDPALLCLVFSNEGGVVELAFRAGRGWDAPVPDLYAKPFRDWLLARYVTDEAWRKAWKDEVGSDESLLQDVRLPERLRMPGPRQVDFMRFVVDLEQSTFRWQLAFAKSLGYEGLATSYNNWAWLQSDITRSSLPAVDQHAYHAHPEGFVEPGARVTQDSSLPGAAAYLRDIMGSRQWGRPFLVTEYGHAFWNGFRREASALVPAYAALQGWDLLTQFSEVSVQLSARLPQPSRRSAIHPFTIGNDPVRRTGERLAALLFARGDVAPAKRRLEYRVNAEAALADNGGWSQLSDTASRLGLVSAIGLSFEPGPSPGRVVLNNPDEFLVDKSRAGYHLREAFRGDALRQRLVSMGNSGETIRPASQRGTLVSDTGELRMDTTSGRFTVETARTVVLLTSVAPDTVGPLSLKQLSVPALVAASSVDGQPLVRSRRILLFVVTDAVNSGMEFQDEARTRLKTLGRLPAKVQPVALRLQLTLADSRGLSLWALTQDGRRQQALPLEVHANGVAAELDTATLNPTPCMLFELSGA